MRLRCQLFFSPMMFALKLTCTVTLSLALAASIIHAQAPEPQPTGLMVNGRVLEQETPALAAGDRLWVAGSVLVAEFGVSLESMANGAWALGTYGHELLVRPDDQRYRLDRQDQTAATAPFYRGDDLFIPLEMIARPLGIISTQGEAWHLQTPAATVQGIRQGTHADKVRFVVDLSAAVQFRALDEAGKVTIEFPASEEGSSGQYLRLHAFEDSLAAQVSEARTNGTIRLVISHNSIRPAQIFTLTDPPRIVIDLLREPVPQAEPPTVVLPTETPALPGLWRSQVFTGSRGPVRGFMVKVSLKDGAFTWRPALAADTIMHRATVSRLATRHQALAAINGGFFNTLGPPLGLLIIDGEWIKGPLYSRAVLGLTRDGKCSIRRVDFAGRVDFTGIGSLPLEGLNQGHTDPDGVVAYTPRWGPMVNGAKGLTRLVVDANGSVVQALSNGEAAIIPAGGFILSGHGRRAESLKTINLGTTVKLILETSPAWLDLWQAIGGGPLLVQDGRVNVTASQERFRADVAASCRPRSAVGLTVAGEMIVLAVQNPGLTLGELASIMVKLGAHDAMNLDGGGSTALVVQGKLLNDPSDGCERAVSNALLIFSGKEGENKTPRE